MAKQKSAIAEIEPELITKYIDITLLSPSPLNPRKTFMEGPLDELAQSIREHGVLSALMVRPKPGSPDAYEIIFGERRFKASKLAGKNNVPCRIEDYDDDKVLELQVIENHQREDVHPYEEAVGYKMLIDGGKYNIETLATKLGISSKTVGKRVRLGELTEDAAKLCFELDVPIAVMELASTLDKNDQYQSLYQYFKQDTYQSKTVVGYRQFVMRNFVYDLAKAPWSLKDENLVPQAGPCTTCPFNSAKDGNLFAGLDVEDGEKKPTKGLCTKHMCFKDKKDAFYDKRLSVTIDKLLKTNTEFFRLSKNYSSAPDGSLQYSQWNLSSKETIGALLGVIVDQNEECGKEVWFKKVEKTNSMGQPEKPRAERLEELRLQRVERAYRYYMFKDLMDIFDRWCDGGRSIFPDAGLNKNEWELLRILTSAITYDKSMINDSKPPKGMAHPGFHAAGKSLDVDSTIKGLNRIESVTHEIPNLFRALFLVASEREIHFGDYASYNHEPATLVACCELAGLNLESIRVRAEKEYPPKKPKGEAKQETISDQKKEPAKKQPKREAKEDAQELKDIETFAFEGTEPLGFVELKCVYAKNNDSDSLLLTATKDGEARSKGLALVDQRPTTMEALRPIVNAFATLSVEEGVEEITEAQVHEKAEAMKNP